MQFDGMIQCLDLLLHAQGLRLALYKGLHALSLATAPYG